MNVFDEMLNDWTPDQWGRLTSNMQFQCVGGRLSLMLGYGQDVEAASREKAWAHLTSLIREQTGQPHVSVQQWNDHPGRPFSEIQAMVSLASLRWDLDLPQPDSTTLSAIA
jgi:hypothetical protein